MTDRRTEEENNKIPEHFLESAGINIDTPYHS